MFPKIEASKFVRNEFDRLKGVCYLDHAGSALYADSQINNVMKDLKTHLYGNPHSSGKPSVACEKLINNIRFKILKHFNTDPEKYIVIFTSGATQALKTVAECFAWNDSDDENGNGTKLNPDARSRGSTFAYTEDNHTSVLGMRELAPRTNLLCLARDEAYRALAKGPSTTSSLRNDYPADSGNSLFVYPAQSNFAGAKYPLEWIDTCRNGALDQYTGHRTKACIEVQGVEDWEKMFDDKALRKGWKSIYTTDFPKIINRWYIVLDAATYVCTNRLDLGKYAPDFVAVSFYKMFGYPTGLGALLVHNGTGVAALRRKKYFGGGTVEVVLARNRHHVFRKKLHEKFEDGTVDFLSVIAVGHGLDALHELAGPMRSVATRTFRLAAHLYHRMCGALHGNGLPVFRMYADTAYHCEDAQGGIVNFNVLRANGDHVGYNEVKNVVSARDIVLRVGCFCNPGACQNHLGHTDQDLKRNQQVVGHICGDHIDLIDGRPTGSVRVSFGYQSSTLDADKLYDTLVEHFWQNRPVTPVKRQLISMDAYNEMDLRVKRIFVYPIKSCGAFETDEWQLESYGFLYDRSWAVITETGVCMTQLEEPKLCLVKPFMDLRKRTMRLVYAENEEEVPMTVPLDTIDNGDKRLGKICWGGAIEGIDCGDEVATWLSWNLDQPGLRLVRCTERKSTKDNKYAKLDEKVVGANQCQYLLTTNSTLKWLQQELIESNIIEMEEDSLLFRFRGNIVVSGNNLPARAELMWKKLIIGGIEFQTDSVCERCKMVNIDQDTSENHYKPLSVLGQHKWRGKTVYGIYLRCEDANTSHKIRVGQQCVVAGLEEIP